MSTNLTYNKWKKTLKNLMKKIKVGYIVKMIKLIKNYYSKIVKSQ